MTLLTALEIKGNYPDNILIKPYKDTDSENWTSIMYMLRDGDENRIHKIMLNFNDYRFESEKEAISKMEEIAKKAIEHIDNQGLNKG